VDGGLGIPCRASWQAVARHEEVTVTKDSSHRGARAPTLRGARPTDAPEVCRLLAGLGYPAETPVVRERLDSFDGARDHVLVAELGGRIVGVLALSLTPRFAEPGMFSRITALAVDASARRRGVGRRLIAEAERIAAANGSTLMQVNSGRRPERAAAHAFYVSLGYADQHVHHILYEKVLEAGGDDLR
jgi:GNAT superfamily N-acetyltransferase